jgi:hypothetical protein
VSEEGRRVHGRWFALGRILSLFLAISAAATPLRQTLPQTTWEAVEERLTTSPIPAYRHVAPSTNSDGVMGEGTYGRAGFFVGDVEITGKLQVNGGKSFRLDHPLDLQYKYLNHSVVESPEMKNVYDGLVELDEDGSGWVQLPEYFEELNRDFRYQLTPIGSPAPQLHVAEEVSENRFRIAGGEGGL